MYGYSLASRATSRRHWIRIPPNKHSPTQKSWHSTDRSIFSPASKLKCDRLKSARRNETRQTNSRQFSHTYCCYYFGSFNVNGDPPSFFCNLTKTKTNTRLPWQRIYTTRGSRKCVRMQNEKEGERESEWKYVNPFPKYNIHVRQIVAFPLTPSGHCVRFPHVLLCAAAVYDLSMDAAASHLHSTTISCSKCGLVLYFFSSIRNSFIANKQKCALAKATLKMSFIFTRANTTAHTGKVHVRAKPETAQHIRLAQWQQRAASAINQMALIKIWMSEKNPNSGGVWNAQLRTIHQNARRAAEFIHLILFNWQPFRENYTNCTRKCQLAASSTRPRQTWFQTEHYKKAPLFASIFSQLDAKQMSQNEKPFEPEHGTLSLYRTLACKQRKQTFCEFRRPIE